MVLFFLLVIGALAVVLFTEKGRATAKSILKPDNTESKPDG